MLSIHPLLLQAYVRTEGQFTAIYPTSLVIVMGIMMMSNENSVFRINAREALTYLVPKCAQGNAT